MHRWCRRGVKLTKGDISKQTVTVLLMLAIVIILLSTFTVIQETNTLSYKNAGEESNTAEATVKLTVVNDRQIQPSSTTGMVTLNIIKN